MPHRSLVLLLVAFAFPYAGRAQEAEDAVAGRALLVGVADYPQLGLELAAPVDDVERLRHALRHTLRLPDSRIRRLVSGGPLAPTARNIREGLAELAEAEAGELVVFYFAGHGSQVPDEDGDERGVGGNDGLDEVILAEDAAAWEPGRSARNAIRDDEIALALDRVRQRGARVWAIFDCCHSGTLLRADAATARGVPAPRFSGLPPAHGFGEVGHDFVPMKGGMVGMYAVSSDKEALEGSVEGEPGPCGLFTYHLSRSLLRLGARVSFAELLELTRSSLGPRPSSLPLAQGDLQQIIASGGAAPAELFLRRDRGEWWIDGGRLLGVTEGDEYAIHASGRRGDPDGLRAGARVTRVAAVRSSVELIPEPGHEAAFAAEDGVWPAIRRRTCVERGRLRLLLVGADGRERSLDQLPTERRSALQRAFDGPELELLSTRRAPLDGRLELDGDIYRILDPERDLVRREGSLSSSGSDSLRRALEDLRLGRNLRALLERFGGGGLPEGLVLSLQDGLEEDAVDASERLLLPGRLLQLRLENRSPRPWEVWVFLLPGDGSVRLMHPAGDQSPLLPAGRPEPSWLSHRSIVADQSLGRESWIVIALPKGGPDLRRLLRSDPKLRRASTGEVGPVADAAELLWAWSGGSSLRGSSPAADGAALDRGEHRVGWGALRPMDSCEPETATAVVEGTPIPPAEAWRRLVDPGATAFPPAAEPDGSSCWLRSREGGAEGQRLEGGAIVGPASLVARGYDFDARGRRRIQALELVPDATGVMRPWGAPVPVSLLHLDRARGLALLAAGDSAGSGSAEAPASVAAALGVSTGELRAFLQESRREPRPASFVDPWELGGRVRAWECRSLRALLVEGAEGRALFVDLDEDARMPAADADRAALRDFDAEFAVLDQGRGRSVHYDRDGDGLFDLVRVDHDADPEADIEFRRGELGWTVDPVHERPALQLDVLGFWDFQYLPFDTAERYERAQQAQHRALEQCRALHAFFSSQPRD